MKSTVENEINIRLISFPYTPTTLAGIDELHKKLTADFGFDYISDIIKFDDVKNSVECSCMEALVQKITDLEASKKNIVDVVTKRFEQALQPINAVYLKTENSLYKTEIKTFTNSIEEAKKQFVETGNKNDFKSSANRAINELEKGDFNKGLELSDGFIALIKIAFNIIVKMFAPSEQTFFKSDNQKLFDKTIDDMTNVLYQTCAEHGKEHDISSYESPAPF
jgi:hypothetical protein